MPANQTYNRRQTRHIETAVRSISVAVGSVVVTPIGGSPVTISAGNEHSFEPLEAGLTIFCPTLARVNIVYGDDVVRPAPAQRARRSRPKRAAPAKRTRPSEDKAAKSAPKSKAKGKAKGKAKARKKG